MSGVTQQDGSANPTGNGTVWNAASGEWRPAPTATNQLTPEQIQQMNTQSQAYQQSAQALQQQAQAQKAATEEGPTLQYNPLNDDGTLKDTFKLPGADKYTDALKTQQAQAGLAARDTASQQAQTGIAQSKENLAMRGGVGANNSALLEAQGLRQGLANQQAASNQSAQNVNDIGVKGASAQMGIDQGNLGTQLTAAQNVNAFNLDKYNQNMAVKAANTQAAATQAAANSGGK